LFVPPHFTYWLFPAAAGVPLSGIVILNLAALENVKRYNLGTLSR
jgi:hypothetical protein